MANSVCSQYRDENLVCPPVLQNNIFTVIGNFIAAPMSLNEASGASSDIILPLSYTDIQPCILPSSPALIPLADFTINVNENINDDEFGWLDAVN